MARRELPRKPLLGISVNRPDPAGKAVSLMGREDKHDSYKDRPHSLYRPRCRRRMLHELRGRRVGSIIVGAPCVAPQRRVGKGQ
jgi:hypothetical protein